uniref:Uncharacterized protein n=1 Tax=Lactuca sativa TaxID=4236 RepID=A0A9R1W065_LACSA|nr:hypothetical protein LSAT_V11C300131820 [Lactuca sativa]
MEIYFQQTEKTLSPFTIDVTIFSIIYNRVIRASAPITTIDWWSLDDIVTTCEGENGIPEEEKNEQWGSGGSNTSRRPQQLMLRMIIIKGNITRFHYSSFGFRVGTAFLLQFIMFVTVNVKKNTEDLTHQHVDARSKAREQEVAMYLGAIAFFLLSKTVKQSWHETNPALEILVHESLIKSTQLLIALN